MDKTYQPKAIETRWYQHWEQHHCFAPQGENTPYCIMLPPPNVTGTLHMGHAFQHTLMDALIRYHRMQGHNTLWQPGTDHAGIATQMVVERQLNASGKTRHDLGRETFIERIWAWKEQSGGTISKQMRRLGESPDWSRERFTMDPQLSKAVTETFVRLHAEGLIYRGQRLVNWDPVLHTAISDLEVVSTEENGFMWHIRYPLANGKEHLVVATTRPETLLGDAAVAVHPNDARYKHLIGQMITLPLCNRQIPIIADDYVDPAFGTGCVKITPAHDFNDYAVGQRHQLPLLNIFNDDAQINQNAPAQYQNLDRYVARKKIIADLETENLLEKIEPHKLKVPRGDRTNAVVEPYLTYQWFVKTESMAQAAIKVVEDGRIKFVPENWSKTYYHWMHNIQDWCISRQLWWGHQIPAWFDDAGNVYVGRDENEIRAQHKLAENITLTQDSDVLDTWFSSALWPFSTLGWPEKTPELKTFYPTSVLVTGFDIIFFWVARMIMLGLKFMDDVPFREVYITGLILDENGQKMSKSKGNIIDPLDLIDGIDLESLVKKRTTGLMKPEMAPQIEKATRKQFPDGIPDYGTDALRFTLAAFATAGREIRFDINRLEGYRNFCNKLWNATRYVLMNAQDQDTGLDPKASVELSIADRWIISELQTLEQQMNQHLQHYRFDLASQAIYDFIWNEYCDWYLELSKPVLQKEATDAAKRGTRRTLVRVLETLLRLLHPIMPFITEEIWQQIAPLAGKTLSANSSIMLQPYPQAEDTKIDAAASAEIQWLKEFILGVRRIRAEMDISPGKPLSILLQNYNTTDQQRVDTHRASLRFIARLENITLLSKEEKAPESATALVNQMQILIPLAGLIDKQAELTRLDKEMTKLQNEIIRLDGKLNNASFVDKAPAEVVDVERGRRQQAEQSLQLLREQAQKVAAL
ncbi:MAG: valine--tRNA ligase [Gammaproteobacteria bacterium]|nr:valine--tRNA ligase [Gammaproteobacteria bacterium]